MYKTESNEMIGKYIGKLMGYANFYEFSGIIDWTGEVIREYVSVMEEFTE